MATLNQTNILSRTNGGRDIYAYVLGQFYREELKSFDNCDRQQVRNPFNGNQRTLLLEKVGDIITHRDLARPSFMGTAFDFAWLFLKPKSSEELYLLLDQVLHLKLSLFSGKGGSEASTDNLWRPQVSFFRNPISNTRPSACVDLATVQQLVTGRYLVEKTLQLRELSNPQEKRRYKATQFPYVTFSGIFASRREQDLIKHSSLVVFDFDDLEDVTEVRQLLLFETALETEMLFVSPSGNGLKWVLRIEPENGSHRDFFQGVSNYLWSEFRLKADASGRDLARACFLGFCPDSYLQPRHCKESATRGNWMDYAGIWKMS